MENQSLTLQNVCEASERKQLLGFGLTTLNNWILIYRI